MVRRGRNKGALSKKHRMLRQRQRTANELTDQGDNRSPSSFVFKRGKVGEYIKQLVSDMRKLMSPYTAIKLEERMNNTLRDFVSVAPLLNVSHFIIFTQTAVGTNMRICRIPRGPTLTFRVLQYSNIKDIFNMHSKPISLQHSYLQSPPLVVLNGFNAKRTNNNDNDNNTDTQQTTQDSTYLEIMSSMLQNMFPSIDISTIQLKQCRRVVLFIRNPADNTIDMRHYIINITPVGINKSIKKIIKHKIVNLGQMSDISDFILNPPQLSDSEIDDNDDNRIVLGDKYYGHGNVKSNKSAIRLHEVGPRLKLQLIKIESDICAGKVLYHAYKSKTQDEIDALDKLKEKQRLLKAQRKAQQAANVAKKRKLTQNNDNDDDDVESPESNIYNNNDNKTDVDYYTESVGQKPDDSEFIERDRRPRRDNKSNDKQHSNKKVKR